MEGEMLDFFRAMLTRDQKGIFLFVTPDSPAAIRAAAAARGVPSDRLVIRNADRTEVPIFMSAADLGIFFIEPVFSKKASSPTKMGEMLALGLPLITNKGIGDVTQIVEETGCGVTIDRFDEAAYKEALELLEKLPRNPHRWRELALPWFDVEIGINRYDSVYRAMAGSNPTDLKAASNPD
jgi:glycosyltransferase involved in cell wall biosynthesis